MQKIVVIILTVLVATAGIGLPILDAIEESERLAYKLESAQALGDARDVVMRADETGRQVCDCIARLKPFKSTPCTPAALAPADRRDRHARPVHSDRRAARPDRQADAPGAGAGLRRQRRLARQMEAQAQAEAGLARAAGRG